MRESSPNNFSTSDPKTGARSDGKSLFRKILAASPSSSRFYPDHVIPTTHKPLRMNTLGDQKKKILRHQIWRPRLVAAGEIKGWDTPMLARSCRPSGLGSSFAELTP